MSRYINADVFEVFGYTSQDGTFDDGVKFVLEKIDEQPTVDVIEVVRCKECSNWDRHWISSLFSENVHYCAFIDGPCSGDFYCGAAIKRQVVGGDKH